MFLIFSLALLVVQDTTHTSAALDLREAYRIAQQQNPRITAARALRTAAQARVPASKLPPDPQLQLGFMNYSLPQLGPMDIVGMRQIQLMQMIPLPGKLGLSGRVASAEAAATGDRARDMEWTVRNEIAMAFYDLYSIDRELVVSRQTLRLLQDIRATAEAMYRVGEGRQADVLRAQVEIGRMIADTVRMTTMRNGMAGRLNSLFNRSPTAVVASLSLPAFPDSVWSLEALLAQSERDRPIVRAAQHDVEAAAARTSLASREAWPDLTVGLQYGERGSEMGKERMGSLMVGASLPIFAGRRQSKMREESRAMQLMSEADLAAMRAQTRSDVTNAYANLSRARNLAALYRTSIIPQAEATAASAQAAYRVGGVDFMTLLDDRMTVNKYRQELFALEAEQGKSWAELEMLLGRELFDPINHGREAKRQGESKND